MSRVLALRNRQRVRAVDLRMLRRVADWTLAEFFSASGHELCIHLVSAREMARVNQTFLKHAGSTDVITFDHSELERRPARLRGSRPGGQKDAPEAMTSLHGEIYISVADAVAQARTFRVTWQSELVRYLIHGLLHMQGFKDGTLAARRRMKSEENRLLKLAARQFQFRDLARRKP
jgi:probable rRNA maturation factor